MKIFAADFQEGFLVYMDIATLIGERNAQMLLSSMVESFKPTHAFEQARDLSMRMSQWTFFNPDGVDGLDSLIFDLYLHLYNSIMTVLRGIYNHDIWMPLEYSQISQYKLYFTIYDRMRSLERV